MIPFMPTMENSILANSDLNSYIEPGTYSCSLSSAEYKTILNCPVSVAFRFNVIYIKPVTSATRYIYGYQEVIPYTAPWNVYRRYIQKRGDEDWIYSNWYLFESAVVSV